MQSVLNANLRDSLRMVAVVPVLTIDDRANAVPLAEALVAGGLTALEITLRTPDALKALGDIARHVPDALVGAGTVLTPEQGVAAIAEGAQFLVSPGATQKLIDAAARWDRPLLPGAATASEAMRLLEAGYAFQKFFPAEQAGGIAALKSLASPLAAISFCPTGGVNAANAAAYLACSNVVCAGGSWVAPAALVAGRDWAGITRLARGAANLRRTTA
jgi:2-dehydro-3-deoxyphosphogluconate aldolase / (4S)-4-hydroxy-2-oxoglutarate aldolase